ncbi:MAG: hypothetical protein U9O95_07190, partial [Candidatus Marinimicrobia bacterium]|nr:hypothetical protein [Candidatus Neomarinimicrobiota bacterium]
HKTWEKAQKHMPYAAFSQVLCRVCEPDTVRNGGKVDLGITNKLIGHIRSKLYRYSLGVFA